jgi:SAM-dependent methyltransferase
MERIPEHELMDDTAQTKAYAEADFSEPHSAFVPYFKERFPTFSGGKVLDLGCGPADITARFAEAFPETFITAVDGSQAMLTIAINIIKAKRLEHRIAFQKRLLPDPTLPEDPFDALISNSLLHHLRDSNVLWRAVCDCAKHGAPVFIMDLMRPDTMQSARDMVYRYAGEESLILQKDFYNSLLAAYTPEEIQEQLYNNGLHSFFIEAVSDRHVIVWGKNDKE